MLPAVIVFHSQTDPLYLSLSIGYLIMLFILFVHLSFLANCIIHFFREKQNKPKHNMCLLICPSFVSVQTLGLQAAEPGLDYLK